MSSISQEVGGLKRTVASLKTRLGAIKGDSILFAALGDYVVYGCFVTEGDDATDLTVKLEGQASGDSSNHNPNFDSSPSEFFQYPNIASTKGGGFFSQDATADVSSAPATGTARYDIAYIFVGPTGAGFAIKDGTPSSSIKTDFDSNGLDTSDYGSSHDPSLPVGALPVARIYVEDDVTGIPDSRIADIRDFKGRLSDPADASFAEPPELGSTTPNVVNATTLTADSFSIHDASFTLQDEGDATKQLNFQLSNLSTSTTRTLSVPDTSDTLAVLGTAQTFTAAQTFNGDVTLGMASQDYLVRGRGLALSITGNTPNSDSFLELFNGDGNGTERNQFVIYGVGSVDDTSNIEALFLRYDLDNTIKIFSNAGGTGTVRPLKLFTGGDTNQLVLNPDGTINSSGSITIGDGSVSPDGTLHVHTGSAGSVTANSGADDLVVEGSTSTVGLSILYGNSDQGRIAFGTPDDAVSAVIQHDDSNDNFNFGTSTTNGLINFNTGNAVTALTLDSSQNANIVSGALQMGGTEVVDSSRNATFNALDDTPIGQSTPAAVNGTTGDFSGEVTVNDNLSINSNSPILKIIEADAPADNQRAWLHQDPLGVRLRVTNDAEDSFGTILLGGRNGATVTSIDIGNSTDEPDVTIYGNLVMGTAGKGIDFSSSGGNILDQYEEGTFTPTLSDGTNNADAYITRLGRYTRIGDRCFYNIYINLSDISSLSGDLRIDDLPFSSKTQDGNFHVAVVDAENLSINAGQSITCWMFSGVDLISLRLWDSTAGTTALQASELTNNSRLRVSGQYEVT